MYYCLQHQEVWANNVHDVQHSRMPCTWYATHTTQYCPNKSIFGNAQCMECSRGTSIEHCVLRRAWPMMVHATQQPCTAIMHKRIHVATEWPIKPPFKDLGALCHPLSELQCIYAHNAPVWQHHCSNYLLRQSLSTCPNIQAQIHNTNNKSNL